MKHKLFSVLLVFLLLCSFNSSVFANTDSTLNKSTESESELTESERQILLTEVGLSEEDLEVVDLQTLRDFISLGATKLSSNGEIGYNVFSESKEMITPMALTPNDITLYGLAMNVPSDIAGHKKIYLYGKFTWLVKPFFTYQDKMSIGFPVTNLWYVNTSGGNVLNHSSTMCNHYTSWTCNTTTTPSDFDIGAGVAAKFDLVGTSSSMYGYMHQYVYTAGSSGTSNVLIRYGHKTLLGAVGVSVGPSFGLAITPTFNTETLDYILTFSW